MGDQVFRSIDIILRATYHKLKAREIQSSITASKYSKIKFGRISSTILVELLRFEIEILVEV